MPQPLSPWMKHVLAVLADGPRPREEVVLEAMRHVPRERGVAVGASIRRRTGADENIDSDALYRVGARQVVATSIARAKDYGRIEEDGARILRLCPSAHPRGRSRLPWVNQILEIMDDGVEHQRFTVVNEVVGMVPPSRAYRSGLRYYDARPGRTPPEREIIIYKGAVNEVQRSISNLIVAGKIEIPRPGVIRRPS